MPADSGRLRARLGALLPGAGFWALLPLVAPQALWVRRRALRLAPATGPSDASIGSGRALELLVFGDSVALGVGVAHLEHALAGQLARALALRTARRVRWCVRGCNGANVTELCAHDFSRLPQRRFDLIVVSVGVNDVTGLTPARRWRRGLLGLVLALRRHSPAALIAVMGVPPLGVFPLLPQPLRWLLGLRARTLDAVAVAALAALPGTLHLPLAFSPRPGGFSDDGYHPGPHGCRALGEALAARLQPALESLSAPSP